MKNLLFIFVSTIVTYVGFATICDICVDNALVIKEICFNPLDGKPQWVEIKNMSTKTVVVKGVELFGDKGAFTVPEACEDMPAGAFLVVYFGSAGDDANDYSFLGDNRAVMYADPGVAIFGNPVGHCSLNRVTGPRTRDILLDFIAWGDSPGDAAKNAVAKRIIYSTSQFIHTDEKNMYRGPDGMRFVEKGDTIKREGLMWFVAKKNNAPVLTTMSGRIVFEDAPTFNISAQRNYEYIEIEISKDEAFSHLEHTQLLDINNIFFEVDGYTFDKNVLYWCRARCKKTGEDTAWSKKISFTLENLPIMERVEVVPKAMERLEQFQKEEGDVKERKNIASKILNTETNKKSISLSVPVLGARKMTNMLITSSYGGYMCTRETPIASPSSIIPWNKPRLEGEFGDGWDELESSWCWAVGAAMINHYYGGNLTTDEIIYHVHKDLPYGVLAGGSTSDSKDALEFCGLIIKNENVALEEDFLSSIKKGYPIYFFDSEHVMVVTDVSYVEEWNDVENRNIERILGFRLLNKDNKGSEDWRTWPEHIQNTKSGKTNPSHFSIAKGRIRMSNSGVTEDADRDGICDFDEEVRFKAIMVGYPKEDEEGQPKKKYKGIGGGLKSNNPDTDGDGLTDYDEVAYYVFPIAHPNGGRITDKRTRLSDVDTDGYYMPVDPDSDDGGVNDGDELTKKTKAVNPDGTTNINDPRDDGQDIVFCVDTTGSMGGSLASVKRRMSDIVDEAYKNYGKVRIAIVAFRDRDGDAYVHKNILSFTSDKASILSAINGLSDGGGGDFPEAVYSALVRCLRNPPGGWYMTSAAKRFVYLFGDAPSHSPDGGYTLVDVQRMAAEGGWISDNLKGVDDDNVEGTGTGELSGPVGVVAIPVGRSAETKDDFKQIAEVTDGFYYEAASGSDVGDVIIKALNEIADRPIITLEVTGGIWDKMMTANASRSVDPNGCGIHTYEWDWDGDGVYDETTFTPVVSHTYGSDGFGGMLRVRATTIHGRQAVKTHLVAVPDFIDVTDVTDTTLFNPRLDPSTGAILYDIKIGNKTTEIKTLKDRFYFVLSAQDGISLATPDGTMDGGRPYVNLTDMIEAILPTIGNGDMNLDPGEEVIIPHAIAIYSRDQTIPKGFIFAVWADPPPEAKAKTHPADVDGNYILDDFEILKYVDEWNHGRVDDFDLLNAIDLWHEGGYSWDKESDTFISKQ